MPIGWDHPDTARYYEEFCRRHGRYADANRALIAAADLRRGVSVLDLAAGTGRTAEAALEQEVEVTCVEPARAMREVGMRRVPGAAWMGTWPSDAAGFERVLCGAAIWQMLPLDDTFARVAKAIRNGGAFVFNIPSLYLGEADQPGGGRDPYLLELAGRLAAGRVPMAGAGERVPSAAVIEALLSEAGFVPTRWCFRLRLTQAALKDWMKIPPLTDAMLDGAGADERAARIEVEYAGCDPDSWRWETWSGWTAWKR